MRPGTEFYLLCVVGEDGEIATKNGKEDLYDQNEWAIKFEDLNKADIRPVDPVKVPEEKSLYTGPDGSVYEILKTGDIIQENDLYMLNPGSIHPSGYVGEQVLPEQFGVYLRQTK